MKKYMRFYGLFMGAALFVSILWIVLVYAQMGVPTESSRWAYESVSLKSAYAGSIKERKILIVSGSNSVFGVSAKTIEKELKIPTLNMAVSAGLQLKYILEQTKAIARPGDVIVLPLEYSMYDYDGFPAGGLIDYVFARDPDYFKKQSVLEKGKFVLGVDVIRLAKGIKNKYLIADEYSNAGYQSRTLNENGDETNNKHENSSQLAAILRFIPIHQLAKGIGKDTTSWEQLDNFTTWCNQNKIAILVTYPSVLYNNAYFSDTAQKTINQINEFWKTRGIMILGTYDESVYAPEYIYDTAYHLNDLGTEKRTRQLIKYLRPHF